MFLQCGPQSEFLIAVFALIRHPPSVESPVLRQIAGGRKGLGTKFTSVGFFPGMSSGVSLQYFIAGETFITQIALKFVFGEV